MTVTIDDRGGTKLIFACSGGSDVGCPADLGAREAAKRGAGKMYCLAGIGWRVEPILETTRSAAKILAISTKGRTNPGRSVWGSSPRRRLKN